MTANTATKLTDADIEKVIESETFIRPANAPRLTLCVLTLANGYTVTGESSCVDPKNYNEATGQKRARENAVSKIWQLEGYRLREAMWRGSLNHTDDDKEISQLNRARLDDLPGLLHKIADDIERGSMTREDEDTPFVPVVGMLVLSEQKNTAPEVFGFGANVSWEGLLGAGLERYKELSGESQTGE